MTWQPCGRRALAVFFVCLVECLLDVAGLLLQLAFHLPGGTLYLLRPIARQLTNLSLDFAGYILGGSLHLIAVHGVLLKMQCMGSFQAASVAVPGMGASQTRQAPK